MEQDNVN